MGLVVTHLQLCDRAQCILCPLPISVCVRVCGCMGVCGVGRGGGADEMEY